MSVPHILSDESAAYYHGYVLAEMSVHQTRDYFQKKFGANGIVDNENVGNELRDVYWKPGNSEQFMELVEKLTGKPLSGDAWVSTLFKSVEDVVTSERIAYEEGIKIGPKHAVGTDVDLSMRIMLVHGDDIISDSSTNGLVDACDVYKKWVNKLE